MRLLNANEVAEILRVNKQRVYELTRQGILPSVRIGTWQIRFEEMRLLQWIENGGGLSATNVEDYKPASDHVTAGSKPRFSEARSGGVGSNQRQTERKESTLFL